VPPLPAPMPISLAISFCDARLYPITYLAHCIWSCSRYRDVEASMRAIKLCFRPATAAGEGSNWTHPYSGKYTSTQTWAWFCSTT